MKILRLLRHWRQRGTPLIEVRISKRALLHNYNAFKESCGVPVAPVLKSNAYGHGLIEVAEILAEARAPMLVVDSVHEAQLLRSNGISVPLLVVGYTRAEMIAKNTLGNIAFTITSLDGLKAIAAIAAPARIHLKLDTGMHRQGVPESEQDEAIQVIKGSQLVLDGLCSHFADADGVSEYFTRGQIEKWNAYARAWREAFPSITHFHLAATAGAAFIKDIDATMVRLGTGLYGFPRHASQSFGLRPALSMRTLVTGIKDVGVGESVGYNITFTAKKRMRIATVPVGYFEGVDRRLSNRGAMMIGDKPCPIIGRVSMNITVIDVSACESVLLETPVTVFSDRPEDQNSLVQAAAICDTTPLELLVHIPQHLRRVIA